MKEQMKQASHEAATKYRDILLQGVEMDLREPTADGNPQFSEEYINGYLDGVRANAHIAYINGQNSYASLVWHTTDAVPEPGRELIVIGRRGIKIYPNPANGKMSWEFFVRISRMERWMYAEDILPDSQENNK